MKTILYIAPVDWLWIKQRPQFFIQIKATIRRNIYYWYDFACEIFRQTGMAIKVSSVTTAEYGLSKAVRPFNSRLDKSKLMQSGFVLLPTWQDALNRYLRELNK